MIAELRKLSADDGRDVYDMLQSIPAKENGFGNSCFGLPYRQFRRWLLRADSISRGEGIEEWMVPQDIYWLYVDGIPVGMSKLRHYLNYDLLYEGGHCGYGIRPGQRGKGYGTLQLRLLLGKAREKHIDKLLITVNNDNLPSVRVAVANGGVIERVTDARHYIWITL